MGFPSPAIDYLEERLSLDKLFISRPSATFFMRAGNSYWRAGIQQGALLIVDRSATPCDGSVVVCQLVEHFIHKVVLKSLPQNNLYPIDLKAFNFRICDG